MKQLRQRDVELLFAAKGWKLLSQYERSSIPLKVICAMGHETHITWNNFQRGQGCGVCAGNIKFTYEQVKQYFADHGCELISTSYEASVKPLEYRCLCGTTASIDFGNFRLGRRCQNCKARAVSEKLRVSEDTIISLCQKYGHTFIKAWLANKRTRIQYTCRCGKTAEADWSNFKRFPNCWECSKLKKSGENCYMYDPDRDAVAMRKKFRKICGQHIIRFMRATGQKKTRRTHELLGYTPKQLQEHILNHPEMAACAGKVWHVDHIFPIQAFLDHDILDLRIINCLDNLRPCPGPENLSKADKYDEKEFVNWLTRRSPQPDPNVSGAANG